MVSLLDARSSPTATANGQRKSKAGLTTLALEPIPKGPWRATLNTTLGRQTEVSYPESVSDSPRLVKNRREKPRKPRRDFPLYAHSAGRWAKKIRGRVYYFGPWGDPDGALTLYLDQKDDLLAGREPQRKREGLTIRELFNRFLSLRVLMRRAVLGDVIQEVQRLLQSPAEIVDCFAVVLHGLVWDSGCAARWQAGGSWRPAPRWAAM